MIKFTDNKNDIIKCWKEAFSDSDEDILFFVENVKNAKCLAYYNSDNIASMLYLVKSNLGLYIYAACTLKEYQKQGIMTKLLNYCKDNYENICLIPANNDLIGYYKNRDFTKEYDIKSLKFNESEEINEYLFEGCELEHPIVLAFERKS